jgi:hypothetical protein
VHVAQGSREAAYCTEDDVEVAEVVAGQVQRSKAAAVAQRRRRGCKVVVAQSQVHQCPRSSADIDRRELVSIGVKRGEGGRKGGDL